MRAVNTAGFLALACVLLLAGCAGTTAESCSTLDWYRQGYVDGLRSPFSLIEQHTTRCAAVGVKPDAERYQKGWADGRFYQDHRFTG